VYSKEEPKEAVAFDEKTGKTIPASIAFVPPTAGLLIASEVIKDLIK
jgi:tRNA A37 threonylcarbamoyladenosine dehydratase